MLIARDLRGMSYRHVNPWLFFISTPANMPQTKGGKWGCKRLPFGVQKVTFYSLKDDLLQTRIYAPAFTAL